MQNLIIFCDVARHRSFSQAAAEHGITQSAVSQRIGLLEKRLGVALLDRSVRPLQLTGAGETYLRGCQELLDGYERLEHKVTQLHRVTGNVRVAAIYSAGIDLLNHVREHFAEVHRRVTVTVEYKQPEAVYDEVRQGRCDLGILSYPQHWRDVSFLPLRDERMSVVCRAGHPLATHTRVQASQLADWSMIAFESQLPVAKRIRRYLRDQGVIPNVDSVFDNIDTIKSAVAVGDCFAILPTFTVQREVGAGTLAVVELGPKLFRSLGVIYAKRGANRTKALAPAVQCFVDFLLQHAGPSVDAVGQPAFGSTNGHTTGGASAVATGNYAGGNSGDASGDASGGNSGGGDDSGGGKRLVGDRS